MKRKRRTNRALPSLLLLVVLVLAAYVGASTLNSSKTVEAQASCPETAPTRITIASFNTLHLGWNNGKDLDELAAILTCYDVIALQEVMKTSALDAVKVKLNARTTSSASSGIWGSVASPLLGPSSYQEHYSILYRTDRVQHVGQAKVFSDSENHFIREPFYADFRAGQFDFTLITMHAVGPGDETLTEEIANLKNVYTTVQNESSCEDDVILVGDFNTPASSRAWSNFRAIATIENLIPVTTKTSLGQNSMSQSYDNVWIQKAYSGHEFTGKSDAHLYFESVYATAENAYSEAKKRISDHVPVWAEFRTDLPDDDGPCP